ncbi:22.0 kDa heat shock protein [Apostasia shenzhenica]|uniref:22.0 kDa heat shock protein n=1 Tax=Apostasia shenzhenica TaxID=1088818 RepID=A0A2I0A5T2_9ASPA|nr:22.0 kDa heat shock protein [Apostasia shenzhenica]
MDGARLTRPQPQRQRIYEDLRPPEEWIAGATADTLIIKLPGFTKDQLKVQIDNTGNLRTSGERPLQDGAGGRWSRFQTEHRVPERCDLRGIRARFDDGILYITLPKLIAEEEPIKPVPTPARPKSPEKLPEQEKMPKETERMPETEKKMLPEPKPEGEPRKEEEEDTKKEAGEKERRTADEGKLMEGGEAVAPAPAVKKWKYGVAHLRRPRQLVVNLVAAVVLLMAIGMYLVYKLRKGGGDEVTRREIN